MNDMVPITRHLPEKLDSYRRQALTDEMIANKLEENRLEDHLKKVSESVKLMIKECKRKQNYAAQTIHQGFEMKEINCTEEVDLEHNSLILRRNDNLEKVEERALTPDELKQAKKKTVVLKS